MEISFTSVNNSQIGIIRNSEFIFLCYQFLVALIKPSTAFGLGYAFFKYENILVTLVPKDGNWTSWSQWSPCSTSCNEGTQSRVRFCNHPAPVFGGKNCTGDGIQSRSCYEQNCTGTIFFLRELPYEKDS